jgi:hypothetical protein
MRGDNGVELPGQVRAATYPSRIGCADVSLGWHVASAQSGTLMRVASDDPRQVVGDQFMYKL